MLYTLRDAAPGESWDEEFWQTLCTINAHCLSTGLPIEGNSFYWDNELRDPYQDPDPRPLPRRRELAGHAARAKRILEIGANAGHSALLMLAAGNAEYWGVDIARHEYTVPCMEYLQDIFGERFNFVAGDSARALPIMLAQGIDKFDFIHVDGSHTLTDALVDIMNAHRLLPDEGGQILVDDMQLPGPRGAVEKLIGESWLRGSINDHFALLRL